MNRIVIVLLFIMLLLSTVYADQSSEWARRKSIGIGSSSLWLVKVTNHPRRTGCWHRLQICREKGLYAEGGRMRCCRGRCVDVASDVNHCGLCGIRCPFSWQCCRALCVNTNFSHFNCGRCGNRCSRGVRCMYGLCGYATPSPPRL